MDQREKAEGYKHIMGYDLFLSKPNFPEGSKFACGWVLRTFKGKNLIDCISGIDSPEAGWREAERLVESFTAYDRRKVMKKSKELKERLERRTRIRAKRMEFNRKLSYLMMDQDELDDEIRDCFDVQAAELNNQGRQVQIDFLMNEC